MVPLVGLVDDCSASASKIVARSADGPQMTKAMLPHDNRLVAAVELLRDDARHEDVRTAGE